MMDSEGVVDMLFSMKQISRRLVPVVAASAILLPAGLLAQKANEPSPAAPAVSSVKPAAPNTAAQNTATTPAPHDSSWANKRHQVFLQQAQKGGIDLLFLGDSITENWEQPALGSDFWNRYYVPRHAAEFGIGGDQTQNLLWRIEHGEVEGLHPKVVVLLIGTNNLNHNSVQEIAEGVQAVVNDLRAKLPESRILLLGLLPRETTIDHPNRIKAAMVNTLIAKLDDGKTVRFLDAGSKFVLFDGALNKSVMKDTVHPNAAGYQILVDAIEPVLTEMWK